MPFTGSHPAAVLALTRTGLPASALVIGSMTPDLPYFVPVRIGSFYPPWSLGGPTHTAWAVPTLDVVLGLAAWAAWHAVLSAPALAAAPIAVRRRLAGQVRAGGSRFRDRRHLLAAAAGVAVGAATHVLWDEFTHPDRWGTRHIGALREEWAGLAGYRWAQYASGLLGALVIAVWLWSWWRRTEPASAPPPGAAPAPSGMPEPLPGPLPGPLPEPLPTPMARVAWVLICALSAVCGVGAALIADGARAAAFAGATRGGAGAAFAATALAVGWHVRRRLRHQQKT